MSDINPFDLRQQMGAGYLYGGYPYGPENRSLPPGLLQALSQPNMDPIQANIPQYTPGPPWGPAIPGTPLPPISGGPQQSIGEGVNPYGPYMPPPQRALSDAGAMAQAMRAGAQGGQQRPSVPGGPQQASEGNPYQFVPQGVPPQRALSDAGAMAQAMRAAQGGQAPYPGGPQQASEGNPYQFVPQGGQFPGGPQQASEGNPYQFVPGQMGGQAPRGFAPSNTFEGRTTLIESGNNVKAFAGTSRARGPGQFTTATWDQVRPYVTQAGLPDDPNDPARATYATAVFARQNANILQKRLGRDPTNAEIGLAHFLGASGALKMINADPNELAKDIARGRAVAANPGVFVPHGQAITVGQLIKNYEMKYANTIPFGPSSVGLEVAQK